MRERFQNLNIQSNHSHQSPFPNLHTREKVIEVKISSCRNLNSVHKYWQPFEADFAHYLARCSAITCDQLCSFADSLKKTCNIGFLTLSKGRSDAIGPRSEDGTGFSFAQAPMPFKISSELGWLTWLLSWKRVSSR